MHIKITHETCTQAIEAAQAAFEISEAPRYLKNINKRLHVIVLVKNVKGRILGDATALSERCRFTMRKQLRLKKSTHPITTIGGKKFFLIIRINPRAFSSDDKTSWKKLATVIGHEMAHLLLIVWRKQINGTCSVSDSNDHNDDWKKVSLWYEGNDNAFIDI
jgi:hypothetical protein